MSCRLGKARNIGQQLLTRHIHEVLPHFDLKLAGYFHFFPVYLIPALNLLQYRAFRRDRGWLNDVDFPFFIENQLKGRFLMIR